MLMQKLEIGLKLVIAKDKCSKINRTRFNATWSDYCLLVVVSVPSSAVAEASAAAFWIFLRCKYSMAYSMVQAMPHKQMQTLWA